MRERNNNFSADVEVNDQLPTTGVIFRKSVATNETTATSSVNVRVVQPHEESLAEVGDWNNLRPYIPAKIRRAGALLHEARTLFSVAPTDVATRIYLDGRLQRVNYIHNFEAGLLPDPPLSKIITAAEIFIDPDDARMRELKEIDMLRQEEQKWFWRLEHDGMSLGEALKCIRLTSSDAKSTFARKHRISTHTLTAAESGEKIPYVATVNMILAGTGFERRQPKVSQRLRLFAATKEPLSIDDFHNENYGDNIRYIRMQLGYTQEMLGKAADGKSRDWISKIENEKHIVDAPVEELLEELTLPFELADYISKKAQGEKPDLTQDVRDMLLDNFYFFHSQQFGSENPFS